MNYCNRIVSAVFALSLATVGCGHRKPSLAEDDPPPRAYDYRKPTDFYGLVRRAAFNFIPAATGTQLAQHSDVIVRGRIETVADGRTFLGGPEDPRSVRTAVAKVKVEDSIRGDSGEYVFVAFWRSLVTPLQQFQETIPSDSMILFLDAAEEQVDTHDPLKGVDDGHVLYETVNPQGMVVGLIDGGVVQPLTDQANWLFQGLPSLETVADALRNAGAPEEAIPLAAEQLQQNQCQATLMVNVETGAAESAPGPTCN